MCYKFIDTHNKRYDRSLMLWELRAYVCLCEQFAVCINFIRFVRHVHWFNCLSACSLICFVRSSNSTRLDSLEPFQRKKRMRNNRFNVSHFINLASMCLCTQIQNWMSAFYARYSLNIPAKNYWIYQTHWLTDCFLCVWVSLRVTKTLCLFICCRCQPCVSVDICASVCVWC